MSIRNHLFFWSIILLLLIGFIVLFQSILMPFILGLILGYLLDPATDKLEEMRIPRGIAAFVVLTGFFVLLFLIFSLLIPILETQILHMIEALPGYIQKAKAAFADWTQVYIEPYTGMEMFSRENISERYGERALQWTTSALKNLWSGGQAIFSLISLLVITPIVAFYLLRDWDKMVAHIDDYLPAGNRATIHRIGCDINETLAGFLRGQGIVCILLGAFYATGLSLVGLESGLLIGLFIGLISFIPYVGAIFGAVLCLGLALLQFNSFTPVLTVAGIFAVGQFLEGNILAPKFVGDNVNLHPVWILFALLAGGSLFGFTGVLIAVPVAAVLGVVTRFILGEYKKTSVYSGKPKPEKAVKPKRNTAKSAKKK